MLTEGDLAPDFSAPTDAGTQLSLSSLRGHAVVLYFYPKDATSGWTIEACEFRDAFPRFEGLDAVVLGVSPDDVKSHRKFKAKHELPFTLLADIDHAIAEKYGVWVEKQMFGRKYWGNARTTFLIGRDGRISKIFRNVQPEGHATEVATELQGTTDG